MSRKARPADIDEICAALPETELGTSWGDRPDLEGARGGRRARGSASTGCRTGPPSTPRPGRCTTTWSSSSPPTEADKAALVEDDVDAVLHHRPLPRLQRGARAAVAAGGDQPRRARRGHHRRVGPPRPEAPGPRAPRWLSAAAAGASGSTPPGSPPSRCSRRSASTTPTPTSPCRKVLAEHGLTGRDAAFATELVSGTIRLQGTYDAIIDACLTKPRLEAKVRDVAAARRPPAAVDAGARPRRHQLVGRAGPRPRRRRARSGWSTRCCARWRPTTSTAGSAGSRPTPAPTRSGYAAVAHSHPRWVVEELADALASAVQLEDLLAADNAPPQVMLVARPGLSTVDGAGRRRRDAPAPCRRTPWSCPAATPPPIPAVAEGRAGVQDEGSQLVALALAGRRARGPRRAVARRLRRARRQVGAARRAGGPAGRAAAGQRAPARTAPRLVARGTRAARAGLLGVVTGDGTRPPWRDATFDRVLVDAPCSGLGALRRRPESRWRRSASDLDVLVPLQRALLTAPLDAVRPGGVVVYATCSPVLAETTEVVDAVVGARDDAPGRRDPPAVAAPRRHRRDVHRHVAPG